MLLARLLIEPSLVIQSAREERSMDHLHHITTRRMGHVGPGPMMSLRVRAWEGLCESRGNSQADDTYPLAKFNSSNSSHSSSLPFLGDLWR